MIIIEVGGGLGNQMFEYMLYLALKERRSDVFLADYNLRHCGPNSAWWANKNLLNAVFVVSEAEYASDKDILRIGDCNRSAFARFRRGKLKIVKKSYINLTEALQQVEHVRDSNPFFNRLVRKIKRELGIKTNVTDMRVLWKRQFEEYLQMKDVYLTWLWQFFAYGQGIEDKVRSELTFKNPLDERNQAIADQIANEDEVSVSVHVRRGDYLLPKNAVYIRLSKEYYDKVMSYFTQRFDNVHFYVFSDGIDWCRENFKADRITFIDWNTGDDSYKDMQLMSLCKHNIIANSSFSSWAAWLNANPDKIVIRPKEYKTDGQDYYWPDEWIAMDN